MLGELRCLAFDLLVIHFQRQLLNALHNLLHNMVRQGILLDRYCFLLLLFRLRTILWLALLGPLLFPLWPGVRPLIVTLPISCVNQLKWFLLHDWEGCQGQAYALMAFHQLGSLHNIVELLHLNIS